MPSYRHHEPGDLILAIKLVFPDSLPPTSVAALESVLPPRPTLPTYPENIHVEEVALTDATDGHARTAGANGAEPMDEDDEEGGQPHVQWCAVLSQAWIRQGG